MTPAEERALPREIVAEVTFSESGRYRYDLHRRWDDGPTALWIMLNPSTADAFKDDPTIRRCIAFSKREGCGALVVLNLFALRSPKPAALTAAPDPVGPENDRYLRAGLDPGGSSQVAIAVAAWGAHPSAMARGREVVNISRGLHRPLVCLGVTKGGAPRHPLYVRGDQSLERYEELA